MKRIALLLIYSSFLVGCASTHDLRSGEQNHLGGGYQVGYEFGGRIPIKAKTNFAPWENYASARSMWAKLAEQACGHPNFSEEDVKEYSYETVPPLVFIKYIVTVKEGYAVCSQ
ncbi:MAG: hypothetical protein PVG66_03470 [Chromatiales bacterium]|jgi:hypothetical protein